jgi:hypothetical protein
MASYFTATVLKAIATNSAGASGSTTFIVTTPAPPAINTVTPSTPQVLDVSAGSQTLSFTLTNSGLAGAVVWEYTPTTVGVTINSGTGDFTIAQYAYFTATPFTIKATNAASVTTQRIVTVTTPAVPTVTSLITSPQLREVSLGPKTIQFTQSTALVGAVTWSYTPTTSGVTIDSSGLLTIDQYTYFVATDFTIKATNVVTRFGTMVMNITTPAPPVIDTVSPVSGQNIDVSPLGGYAFPAFTNTASLTGTLVWSYTTARSGVTIGESTGVFDIAQGTYFTVTTFVIRVTNPVNISNTRSFTVTTPTPPVITGPTSTIAPFAGAGTGGVQRVYVNNATAKTVTIAQTAANTGTITWADTGSLPTGVTLTPVPSNTALTFRIGTTAVLRPAASAFVRANSATNPAGKASSTISYDVFTPQTPALGTLSPAPVPLPDGKIILDTSTTSQTITIPQTVAAANTDPLIWTVTVQGAQYIILSGDSTTIGLATVTASDTQLTVSLPASSFVADGTSVTVSARNRADMLSATTSFTLFVPVIAVFTQLDTQYTNTSAGAATFTLFQSADITASAITYSTTPNAETLQATGITYSASGNNLLFSVAKDTVITSGQSITVFATNGAGVAVQTLFTVYAGNPPFLVDPGDFELDTTTAKTITVTNTGGAVVEWDTPTNFVFPTGAAFLSSTGSQYVIAVDQGSIFGSTEFTVTGKNQYLPAGSSVLFNVAANIKPVVTTPGPQNFNTTTAAQSFTVSQTSAGTGIVWSIAKSGGGSAAPLTISYPTTNASVTVNIPQTTTLAATNYVVTATNIAGATATSAFSVAAYYYVAPTFAQNSIPDFPNLNSASGYSFVTASISNAGNTSELAGPVVYTISPDSVGVSINSSSGAISIATSTIFTTTTFTVTATGQRAPAGTTTFQAKANIAPALTLVTSSLFNENTYSAGQALVQLSQTSGGTEIVWSSSASPATGRYQYPASGYVAPNLNVQTNTYCQIYLDQGAIYDGGTQGTIATITVTATNSAGSVTITTNGYAYPYIIYNWNSTIGPNSLFGMFFPNKTSGSGGARKYSSYFETSGVGRLGCFTNSSNQVLLYDYTTRRITYPVTGKVMRGSRNVLTTFENNTGNESRWVYQFPESGQTTVGWWYNLSDGTGWRLNGGLSGGNDTQMFQEGDGDINAQIQNLV